jgi:hypothetical protein
MSYRRRLAYVKQQNVLPTSRVSVFKCAFSKGTEIIWLVYKLKVTALGGGHVRLGHTIDI